MIVLWSAGRLSYWLVAEGKEGGIWNEPLSWDVEEVSSWAFEAAFWQKTPADKKPVSQTSRSQQIEWVVPGVLGTNHSWLSLA